MVMSNDTKFWLDPWFPCGRLKDSIGVRAINDLALWRDLKLSYFSANGDWSTPLRNARQLRNIFSVLNSMPQANVDSDDEIIGSFSDEGKFKLKFTDAVPNPHRTPWCSLIWFNGNILEHCICVWIAIQNGLN